MLELYIAHMLKQIPVPVVYLIYFPGSLPHTRILTVVKLFSHPIKKILSVIGYFNQRYLAWAQWQTWNERPQQAPWFLEQYHTALWRNHLSMSVLSNQLFRHFSEP